MTDEIIVRARQNCCRLCLAPDSECVPILTSLAADKEPLSSKIQACVNVKVNQSDRLSLRICHSCISFLNAWQSFKNRCLAAQMKQLNWLEMAKSSMRRQIGQMQQQQTCSLANGTDVRSNQSRMPAKPATGRPMPIPMIIKEEPLDEEADAQEEAAFRMSLNPAEFLDSNGVVPKQELEDEDEFLLEPSKIMNDEGPQILTSLGLTQIKRVNPYSQLSIDAGHTKRDIESQQEASPGIPATQCRFCNMSFSSATNARRHERNLHRATDMGNAETPKFCIKPTAPRSLLKPLHTLRPNSMPSSTSSLSVFTQLRAAPPPVTPEMMGVYDYDKPEKYRHLLTDSKLLFIRKHEDFLKQYQTMTCTCCPQTFPSYKAFMAHMRRKYTNLARNLCFKCLKQFQSKTPFVAHLKKRNCINLYKLYNADNEIPKTGNLVASPEKVGTKELLNNKVYECKLCSKTFRLKLDFRSHVYEAHGDSVRKDSAPGRCGFCNMELEDPTLRRRHYNNMECIVMIHCGTCKEKFEFHQQFIDHVYELHLPSPANNNDVSVADTTVPSELSTNVSYSETFNSRLPHSCNICGQTYNNYYNVLRHMEGKHPDQVPKRYVCDKCDAGFPRQGPLRDHMYEVHGTTLPRVRREMLSCRMCTEQIDSKEKWLKHQTEQHSRYTCCFCAFQTKSLEDFKDHIETHPQLAVKNNPIPTTAAPSVLSVTNGGNEGDDEDEDENLQPTKKIKLEPSEFECPVCHAGFSGNVALSNHMRSHYSNEVVKYQSVSAVKNSLANPTMKNTSTPIVTGVETAMPEQVRRIRCHLCSKRFTSKKTYRKHMLIEHQVKNVSFIKCSICKAEFTHERGLRVHLYKTHGTILTSENINATYECEICDAEFKSEKSLNQHKGMVHKNRDKDTSVEANNPPVQNGPIYWYQCSYCPAHFETNKKLAIHLNSHTEFDANDYSCKDCGNVYNGRKSLWVHRYKKHREVPNPTGCPICKKLFFTNKMLQIHITHHGETGGQMSDLQNIENGDEQNKDVYDSCKQVAENEEENDEDYEQEDEHGMEQDEERGQEDFELLAPKVHCSVCNEEFTDQDLFDKHMEMHQIDLYSDNPLAAMFDTGPDDPNQYFMNRMSDNGAYTCDICPKTFPALTALKVHRNWHFRQDGKQIPADSKMKSLAQKKKATNVCEYCDTGFSSASNLRRHIMEVHNRGPHNNSSRVKKFVDKYLECTKCNMKFDEKPEWVKHKMTHATESFISPFEWGCEICGKIVSRKERLVQHMNSHLRSRGDAEDGNGSVVSEDQGNSQDTVFSSNTGRQSAAGKPRTGEDDEAEYEKGDNVDAEETRDGSMEETDGNQENIEEPEESINDVHEEEDDSDDDDENGDDGAEGEDGNVRGNQLQYDEDSSQQYQEVDPDQDDIQDDEEENDEEEGEEEEDQDNMGAYSCDLCQVYFETSKQLRRHVTSHFLNGPGSVTLTEIPKEKSYASKIQIGDDVTTITPV